MARTFLAPGFRFHPTDVELVMYYLKRKLMGKKLHAEAIAEVNIYKFSPWDLPDKSCVRSKDLEWFFFCPREKKYASGSRVKRATESGFWKTTGKDRPVYYNDKTVGAVRTLVFHIGHAPQGERTDWVIHEYRILDDHLAAAGVQDMFVLCKVFKKNGPGPKTGAQYGAPFNEEDWADDDVDVSPNRALTPEGSSLTALLPEKQSSVLTSLFDPGSASGPSVKEGVNEKQSSLVTSFFDPGSTSHVSLIEECSPPSAGPLNSDVLVNERNDDIDRLLASLIEECSPTSAGPLKSEVLVDGCNDEIDRLLASFTDDNEFLYNENGSHEDAINGKKKNNSVLLSDECDLYSCLGNLDNSAWMNDIRLDFPESQKDGYHLNNVLSPDNLGYIELNDLEAPLNFSSEVIRTEQLCGIFGSHSQENMQHFCTAGGFTGMNQYASSEIQVPALPDRSMAEGYSLNVLQTVNDQFHMGSNSELYDLQFAQGQPGNMGIGVAHRFNRHGRD